MSKPPSSLRNVLQIISLLLASVTFASERILSYHSDINVSSDGSMSVTETIRVQVEHDLIRRGIYRDFPTRYEDRFGNAVTVVFELLGARRDGRSEPFDVKYQSNGVRVYLGSERSMAPVGEVTYEIRYRTDRQLGHFGDRDELYWNVNGLGWGFPVDEISASVQLPNGADIAGATTSVYTGSYRSRGADARSSVDADGLFRFETTRSLQPYQGMTIVVDWPAGAVTRPTPIDRIGYFLGDNAGALITLLGFILYLGYLVWAWHRVGRDPEPGPIFPHYKPPTGLSAAAVRYLDRMAYDGKAFTAAIVSLGVKGYLRIHEGDDEDYALERLDTPPRESLSPGEAAVLDALLGSQQTLSLEVDNHATFQDAQVRLEKTLRGEYRSANFNTNRMHLVPAALIGVATVVLALILRSPLFAVPAGMVMLVLIGLFVYLIKAPTLAGRRLMDRIAGFELYLSVAERDELALKNPPGKTPELFERYLPYAIALGVAGAWGERFESVLAASARGAPGYQPYWYNGPNFSVDRVSSFSTAMASNLGGAISAASTPPGSSSGSGGGGFSGGGGGGGGGGGW
jgi:uncharacterized membrane protein YgcG